MKRTYVAIVRGARAIAARTGLLAFLERRAATSRLALWFRSLFAIYDLDDLARLDIPWWTFDSSARVATFLADHPGSRAFEWGSGSSTLWLSSRCSEVISIEHDPQWFESMLPRLLERTRLIRVEPSPSASTGGVVSKKPGFEGLDFSDYVDAIDRVEGTFGIIVIDGRAREACFAKALERLDSTGIIVFDNVSRARYRDAIRLAEGKVDVVWTRGLTPCLPYPDQTAIISVRS